MPNFNCLRTLGMAMLVLVNHSLSAQSITRGKVVDAETKEPIGGATITCGNANCFCGCVANSSGLFEMSCTSCNKHIVSSAGYSSYELVVGQSFSVVSLEPIRMVLDKVIVSANRGEGMKRSDAPVSISRLTNSSIQDAKASSAEQLLNKVSGVNMVNLGNEQHQMSIRQPMSTKSLFLYLEDGIPIRTTGLFNHNALLEMNLAATKSIEVIKGPSSSLYGSEAIGGVVNFITLAPTALPTLKMSAQASQIGYRRADIVASNTFGRTGLAVSGYFAGKKNGFMEYSDFSKGVVTARMDNRLSDKAELISSVTFMKYSSDMAGGVNSAMFAGKSFTNPHTFTYRSVSALRYRSSLVYRWNQLGKTTVTFLYRNNSIQQNPAYRVKDDYRFNNGSFSGSKELAHGEENENRFSSYSVMAQHRHLFSWKKSEVITGFITDISPSSYNAIYLRINKDTLSGKYVSYRTTDSLLSSYHTLLNNYATFTNLAFSPAERLRIVASIRFDMFHYTFNNNLGITAFSGIADTRNVFKRASLKFGATYKLNAQTGFYANYSEGFVPPQVTELYTGRSVPDLKPSVFYNYEVGGWAELIRSKLSADVSVYRLKGTDEIISVKLDDGSFANRNAGRTSHEGIEVGFNYLPVKQLSFRFGGAYSVHSFESYSERGTKLDGKQMNNAPRVIYNAEAWFKPAALSGFRIGAEVQAVGSYFVDPSNTAKYQGYTILNIRTGYAAKGVDLWINVLNALNRYYSYLTTKSAFGYSYQVAEPVTIQAGVAYDFTRLFAPAN